MAGRHYGCNGRELGQTLGDGEGQRGLACYSPWGRKELDMTERLHFSLSASLTWNLSSGCPSGGLES